MCEQGRPQDRNSADKVNPNYRYHEMPRGLPVPHPVPHWSEKVPVSNHMLLLLGLGRAAARGHTSHGEQWWELDVLGTQLWPSHPSTEPTAPPALEWEQPGAAGACGDGAESHIGSQPQPS